MKVFSVMGVPALASAAVSPLLIWSTALVWLAVALALASVVGVLAGEGGLQLRGQRAARASWSTCMPLQACTLCAR